MQDGVQSSLYGLLGGSTSKTKVNGDELSALRIPEEASASTACSDANQKSTPGLTSLARKYSSSRDLHKVKSESDANARRGWVCKTCTLVNLPDVDQCDACDDWRHSSA
jgi:hypothetical protein